MRRSVYLRVSWLGVITECFSYVRAVILSPSRVSYFIDIVALLKSANLLPSWFWFCCADFIQYTMFGGSEFSDGSVEKSGLLFLVLLYLMLWAADSARDAFGTVRSQVHHLPWLLCSPLPRALISLLHHHNGLWFFQWYGTFCLNFTGKCLQPSCQRIRIPVLLVHRNLWELCVNDTSLLLY